MLVAMFIVMLYRLGYEMKIIWMFLFRSIRFTYKRIKRLILRKPLYISAKTQPLLVDYCDFERVYFPMMTNYPVCNPSIINDNGKYIVSIRGVNYFIKARNEFSFIDGHNMYFDTQNYLTEVSYNLKIEKNCFIEDGHLRKYDEVLHGVEDIRLFKWRSEIWMIGSALNQINATNHTTMLLCKLDGNKLTNHTLITSPCNSKVEKNWMPWVIEENLYFIYRVEPLIIYQYVDGELLLVKKISINQSLSKFSGSSCVVAYNGKYFAVIHEKLFDEKLKKLYYDHKLIMFDECFNLIKFSKSFRFECAGVEFCAGLSIHDNWIIFSYGVMDCKAVLLRTTINQFNDFLSEGFL